MRSDLTTPVVGRRFLTCCLGAALLLGAAASAFAATASPEPAPAMPEPAGQAPAMQALSRQVNQAMNLRESVLESLDIDPTPDIPVSTPVVLDGVAFNLNLYPFSIRKPDYTLRAQLADGSIVNVDPGPLRTVRGSLFEVPGSLAAGSLLEDGLHVTIRMPDGRRYWIEPAATRVPTAPDDVYVVYRGQDVIPSNGKCGVNDQLDVEARVLGGDSEGGIAGSVLRCVDLAADADFEYYQDYGSNVTTVQNRINLVINTMNVQYESECNIRHLVVTIIVRTAEPDPYTSTDPDTLLGQLKTEWINNQGSVTRDIAHLFTGKNIDGGVIGIGFLPGFCTGSNGYSLVQSDCCGSLGCATDLSAHELGHNWNAPHCSCPSNTMNPNITCANEHAAESIATITSYLNAVSCDSACEIGTTTLPFSDSFPTTTIDPAKWTGIQGAVSNTTGTNEPSAPNSVDLDGSALGGDQIRSAIINTAGLGSLHLQYKYEKKGGGDMPETGDDLVVEYANSAGNWIELERQLGGGSAMTNYVTRDLDLPPAAFHANFRLRFRAESSQNGNDDWFVDDVSLTGVAAPPNNTCNTSTLIGNGSFAFNTLGASTDGPNEPTACNFNGFTTIDNDVWYRYTAACTGTATASLCGADFDARVAIYNSCPTLSTPAAVYCNDNFCGTSPQISWPVTAGQLFRIRVGGTNGARGTGVLVVSCATPPPPTCQQDIAPAGGDGQVNIDDLFLVINNWGAGAGNPADINDDNIVNIDDLFLVINNWGPCP